MFKRIIVPLDGSGRAERALPAAAWLARAGNGTIFLVRVLDTGPETLPTAPARPQLVQAGGETDRLVAESYLEGIASSEMLGDLSVQTEVPLGLVSPSILSLADMKHADIIVMCSHGFSGVKNWMLGSVAAKVARFSQVPVLILREGGPVLQEQYSNEQPLRVLVPLDGSDNARAAIVPAAQLAAALATPTRAVLHLFHVVRPVHEMSIASRRHHTAHQPQADMNMAKEYLDAIARQLHDSAEEYGLTGLNVVFTTSVASGDDIAHSIISTAENKGDGTFGGYDIVALTTQGYGGPQRWVGSITERVLDRSRLPLLVVRPGE
jgi:nucleotide-binding universal stress UspA family protein